MDFKGTLNFWIKLGLKWRIYTKIIFQFNKKFIHPSISSELNSQRIFESSNIFRFHKLEERKHSSILRKSAKEYLAMNSIQLHTRNWCDSILSQCLCVNILLKITMKNCASSVAVQKSQIIIELSNFIESSILSECSVRICFC